MLEKGGVRNGIGGVGCTYFSLDFGEVIECVPAGMRLA